MKINELFNKPVSEVVKEMDVIKFTPCTNDNNEIVKIIVEYIPKTKIKGQFDY